MLHQYKVGDIAYLVESNRFIREGKITNICGDFVTFRFIEHGGTKIKAHRLFPTEEAAQSYIDALKPPLPDQPIKKKALTENYLRAIMT